MGTNAGADMRPLNFGRTSPKPAKAGDKTISDYFSPSNSTNTKRKKRATPGFQSALESIEELRSQVKGKEYKPPRSVSKSPPREKTVPPKEEVVTQYQDYKRQKAEDLIKELKALAYPK